MGLASDSPSASCKTNVIFRCVASLDFSLLASNVLYSRYIEMSLAALHLLKIDNQMCHSRGHHFPYAAIHTIKKLAPVFGQAVGPGAFAQ